MSQVPLEDTFAYKLLRKFDSMRGRVEHYIAVIDLCPLPAFICTRDAHDVFFVNHAFTKLLGKTVEHLQAMRWLESIHPDDREKVKQFWGEYVSRLEDNVTTAHQRRYLVNKNVIEAILYTTPLVNNGIVGYIVPTNCATLLALGINLGCDVQKQKLAAELEQLSYPAVKSVL
jgi:PAS domain S-box-containing protein